MTPPDPVERRAALQVALLAAGSPLKRARLITLYARRTSNLPPDLAEQRRVDLIAARAAGYRVCEIARYLRVSPSRVCQLAPDPTDTPQQPNTAEPEESRT